MKTCWSSILFLFLSSCSNGPEWVDTRFDIAPEFLPYVDSWNANFPEAAADSRLVMRWSKPTDGLEGAAGMCVLFGWGRAIQIDRELWMARPRSHEALIWHELGHCVGAIKCHRDEMSWGVADHVMHSIVDMVSIKWGELREYYIEDVRTTLSDPEGFCSTGQVNFDGITYED